MHLLAFISACESNDLAAIPAARAIVWLTMRTTRLYCGYGLTSSTMVAALLALLPILATCASPANEPVLPFSQPAPVKYEEWKFSTTNPSDSNEPAAADIIAAAQCYADGIKSWNLEYRLRFESYGADRETSAPVVMQDELLNDEIASEAGLRIEQTQTRPAEPSATRTTQITDGRLAYWYDGIRRVETISDGQTIGPAGEFTYRDILATRLPSRTWVDQSPDLPDLQKSLHDLDLHLLPQRVMVNGRACFLLESRTTTHPLVFKTKQEADGWIREHPDYKGVRLIDPSPTTRTFTHVRRIAVDPQAQYMPVRLVTYLKMDISGFHIDFHTPMLPQYEIRICSAAPVDGVMIPMQGVIFRYGKDLNEISERAQIDVQTAAINRPVSAGEFAANFPAGTQVIDSVRGTHYISGDSQSVATAAKEKAFYDDLLARDPSELRADQWLIGPPLTLKAIKGRPVILHFWNIDCGSCVAAIPRLEQQYGNTLSNESGPLFISIHSYCGGADLQRAREFLKSNGVTFPVMLDAPAPAKESWGLTNDAYHIQQIPQDAQIDAAGRLVSVGDHKQSK